MCSYVAMCLKKISMCWYSYKIALFTLKFLNSKKLNIFTLKIRKILRGPIFILLDMEKNLLEGSCFF